ncbi:MAG: HD domain-containing protein [Pseudothermotoga sp.]|nr:HD domain-containing protein [Pseudothermotoga sp.]
MGDSAVKSIKGILRNNSVFIAMLVITFSALVGALSVRERTFHKEYQEIRKVFNTINSVVAGREPFDVLLPTMEKFGFDSSKYKELLSKYESGMSNRESVIAEIRSFTTHLRTYEARLIQEYERFLSVLIWISWLSLPLLIILLIWQNLNVRRFVNRTIEKFVEISNKFNLSPIDIEEAEFEEEKRINSILREMNLVQSVYNVLRSIPPQSSIEDFIYASGPYLCDLFNSQRFSVALIDTNSDQIIAETAYLSDSKIKMHLKPGFSQRLFETSLSTMLKENQRSRIINDLQAHFNKTNSKSTDLILKEGFRSNMTVLATVNNVPFGFFFLSSINKDNYKERDKRLFEFVSEILSQRLYYSLTSQKLVSHFAASLTTLAKFRDAETGNHVERVAWYSRIISESLELSPKLVRMIFEFAPLHDIGKIGISDSILFKPGRLDAREWEIMKSHVEIGVEFVKSFTSRVKDILNADSLKCMLNIISDHHERYDGKGYPKGKSGEQISIEGRIVAISDVFDALTSVRPYKRALSFEESLRIIVEGRGTQFDPKVVDAFLREEHKIREIYEKFKD